MMPITKDYTAELETAAPSRIEFDLFDLLMAVAERKGTILLMALLGALIALILVMFVHPSYTAKSLIMPPQQGQSGSAVVSQFGGLAAATGLGGMAMPRDPNDLFLGLMQSHTLEDALINRFHLQAAYNTPRLSGARLALEKSSKFMVEKGGLISITVKDSDPHRAAEIANAYVEELHNLNSHIAISEASRRRLFFAEQLEQEKDRLADAEVALKKTEESTGAISPVGQTAVVIQQVAQLQSQITMHQVQLEALRTSSTDENPDVIRLNSEVSGLRTQLKALESARKDHPEGDITFSSRGVPEAQLAFVRKQRDVTYHTLLFDLIAKQYEAARLDEAKAAPVIQLIDPAETPDRKSAPFRALWVLIGGFIGFVFGSSRVIGSYVFGRVNADDVLGRRLSALRHALRFRSK
jgi:tyrosine-protein kinase Etk/Wzc